MKNGPIYLAGVGYSGLASIKIYPAGACYVTLTTTAENPLTDPDIFEHTAVVGTLFTRHALVRVRERIWPILDMTPASRRAWLEEAESVARGDTLQLKMPKDFRSWSRTSTRALPEHSTRYATMRAGSSRVLLVVALPYRTILTVLTS
jgi:hypothetical protein